ncbi:unnamed protein product [Rotaria sp. Silwood2]|nr:unnamed protein product [Rotaria sp. Silwood2]CAF3220051.1 unnamed protein product [Rotaria sp. Silwood2]
MMPLDNPYQITTAATVVTTTFPPSTTTPPSSTTTTTSSSSTTTTTTTSSASTTTTATTSSTTTTTTKCFVLALKSDLLILSIDETVEPCEDFYHFPCGTWLKNARIPEDTGVQNIFNLLDTQLYFNIIDLLSSTPGNGAVEPKAVINARNLYKSCINETNIEIDDVELVLSIINTELGGWPILQGVSWNVSTFNLSNFLLKLRKYDNEIAFSVAIATDKKNASVYDIGVRNNTCLTFF